MSKSVQRYLPLKEVGVLRMLVIVLGTHLWYKLKRNVVVERIFVYNYINEYTFYSIYI